MGKAKRKVVEFPRTPKIEKNIPIPPRASNGTFSFMANMDIGDSFYLSNKQWDVLRAVGNARNWAKNHGMNISSRADEGGSRIWRTE